MADYNGDGKLDLIINNNNAAPTIYLNALKNVGRCIEMKLVGTRSNRDAVGARVRLGVAGKTLTRQVEAGSGYASEAMLPIHFGLADAANIESVEITWPDGFVQQFKGAQLDQRRQLFHAVSVDENGSSSPEIFWFARRLAKAERSRVRLMRERKYICR